MFGRRVVLAAACLLSAVALAMAAAPQQPAPAVPKPVDFEHDIRPIFSKHCYSCHSVDQAEASLRLDRRSDALKGGNSGPAIKPGQSDQSPLVSYIAGTSKDDLVMPPEGERLSTTEVALIKHWIDQGAQWPEEQAGARRGRQHWSFQPIAHPRVPPVHGADWVRNPIDAFVLSRLESLGIEPSPEADRVTLIRRLHLDLLGLPPSPREVDEFLADTHRGAYEHLVDRLLASPHYGERYARHWLDLARYADSDGYEKDNARPHAWRYRHWVIDALNRDLPFDQFTIEQLAGDLLDHPTSEQLVATGFHRNTLTNTEGGVDKEEYRVAATIDRTNTTGAVWLGLTVGCAQCHTHKYDPILQREYYGLFAFFNSAQEQNVAAPTAEELARYAQAKAEFDRQHEPLTAALAKYEQELRPSRQAIWEANRIAHPMAPWDAVEVRTAEADGGTRLEKQPDGSLLATGDPSRTKTYTLVIESSLTLVTNLRLELLADRALPDYGPGRGKDGAFSLAEITVRAVPAKAPPRGGDMTARIVKLQNARADTVAGETVGPSAAIDGNLQTAWTGGKISGRDRVAVFETVDMPDFPWGTVLTIQLTHGPGAATLGRFRVSVTTTANPAYSLGVPDVIEPLLAVPAARRTAAERERLAAYFRTQDPAWRKRKAAIDAHQAQAPVDPRTASKAQTLGELPGGRKTNILVRGDFLRPGAEVQPDTLEVLHAFQARSKKPDRLDLARWLMDPANPLTPRVVVNRFWALHFGRGLVPTVEDFGTQGEKPSHPELLDWLAGEFVRQGWSMKRLHKLIVSSATYRQASRVRPELAEHDPTNVWLSRQRRLRVEAEVIRDLALAASGLLNEEIGGASVRPPQPAGVAELTYGSGLKWVESAGRERYRRGLYTWFQRTSPYPMLTTFDAPESNVTCTRRERSNTPLQALTLLNDPVFFECAQALGRRMATEFPRARDSNPRRAMLGYAFRLCLARQPAAAEWSPLEQLYASQLTACLADPKAAAELVGSRSAGEARQAGLTTAELAAGVIFARALMNLDEFITRE